MKILLAFLLGGVLCAVVQVLIDKTSITPARILVSFAVGGVILGAFGVFDKLRDVFGCGVTVPLLGFGANVAKGVREAVDADGIFGVIGGAFKSAGVGLGASLFLGFLVSLFVKGSPKRQ